MGVKPLRPVTVHPTRVLPNWPADRWHRRGPTLQAWLGGTRSPKPRILSARVPHIPQASLHEPSLASLRTVGCAYSSEAILRRILAVATYVSRRRSRCALRQTPLPSLISVLLGLGPNYVIRPTCPRTPQTHHPNTPNTRLFGRASIPGTFLKVGWVVRGGMSERAAPSEGLLCAETKRSSHPRSSGFG